MIACSTATPPGKIQLCDVTRLDHRLANALHRLGRDAVLTQTHLARHFGNGQQGTGGADGHVPADVAIQAHERAHLQARGNRGATPGFLVELTRGEEILRHTDAA
jgi:hypothetical protein